MRVKDEADAPTSGDENSVAAPPAPAVHTSAPRPALNGPPLFLDALHVVRRALAMLAGLIDERCA